MRFPTAFGEFAIVWDESGMIRRIYLPGRSATLLSDYPGAEGGVDRRVGAVADGVSRFLGGRDMRFSLEAVALDACTGFQKRVLMAEYGIPRGRVSTYGRIARHLGVPGRARAVGTALAHNPFPIIIPCHRAVAADGTLGGYQGGPAMKQALLEMEGVRFSSRGRVLAQHYYYEA